MSRATTAHRALPPNPAEITLARSSAQRLGSLVRGSEPLRVRVIDRGQEAPIELPAVAVDLLLDILGAMAAGQGVTIIPENAELTTVQAAGVLNVSRPFLIKLLEDNAIPHRKVGKHRRVRMEDVMTCKARIDRDREAVLDALVADAQEQGMAY